VFVDVGEDDLAVWDTAYAWWVVKAGGRDGVPGGMEARVSVFPDEGNVEGVDGEWEEDGYEEGGG
ncbi:MAG: hypothetical protein Q9192_006399, partial [Flavoplaca navasiana]